MIAELKPKLSSLFILRSFSIWGASIWQIVILIFLFRKGSNHDFGFNDSKKLSSECSWNVFFVLFQPTLATFRTFFFELEVFQVRWKFIEFFKDFLFTWLFKIFFENMVQNVFFYHKNRDFSKKYCPLSIWAIFFAHTTIFFIFENAKPSSDHFFQIEFLFTIFSQISNNSKVWREGGGVLFKKK